MSTTRPDYNFSFTFLDQLWSVQNELNCMSGRKSRSISLRLIWMIVLHILHSDAICQCLIWRLLYNEKVFNLAFYMFIDIGKWINFQEECRPSRTQKDERSSIRACLCTSDFCNALPEGLRGSSWLSWCQACDESEVVMVNVYNEHRFAGWED